MLLLYEPVLLLQGILAPPSAEDRTIDRNHESTLCTYVTKITCVSKFPNSFPNSSSQLASEIASLLGMIAGDIST